VRKPNTPMTMSKAKEIIALKKRGLGSRKIAEVIGVPRSTVRARLKRASILLEEGASDEKVDFKVQDLPDPELPVEEIIAHMKRVTERDIKAFEARKLINISVKLDGPIGLAHFGDPHIDNHGCDWNQLEADVKTVRDTKGLFGGNVGDTTDNWSGRLAALYSLNPNTRGEVRKLVEWFCSTVPWMYFLLGNHDIWTGGSNVMEFIKNSSGVFEPWSARMKLTFPNSKEVRINARHDFPGQSMWNQMHGQLKESMLGNRDHILVAGHRHTSGHMIVKDSSSGLISHLLRVSGYKRSDHYANEGGFRDSRIRASSMTIINPTYRDDDPRLIRTELDLQEGAEILTWMRSRHERGKSSDVGSTSRSRRSVPSRRLQAGQRDLRPEA
jgi:hypothetical protein